MRTAYTAEERINVEAYGTYEEDYKNGEIWDYNGEQWYLSHMVMSPSELRLYMSVTELD